MSYRQGKQQRRQPTLATETAKTEDDSMETASTETPHIESTLHLKEVDRGAFARPWLPCAIFCDFSRRPKIQKW